jgi:hypothetical protein
MLYAAFKSDDTTRDTAWDATYAKEVFQMDRIAAIRYTPRRRRSKSIPAWVFEGYDPFASVRDENGILFSQKSIPTDPLDVDLDAEDDDDKADADEAADDAKLLKSLPQQGPKEVNPKKRKAPCEEVAETASELSSLAGASSLTVAEVSPLPLKASIPEVIELDEESDDVEEIRVICDYDRMKFPGTTCSGSMTSLAKRPKF